MSLLYQLLLSSTARAPRAPRTAAAARTARWRRTQRGQASVEYALVLLGAALVATLLIGWATRTDLLNQLFDHVLGLIRGKAT